MNNRWMFGFVCLAMFANVAVRGDVTLVENGKPMAEIVIPKDPLSSVKLAAADVQKYVKLMSGAELPIVESPTKDVKSHVYVGESELTKALGVTTDDLEKEGFKIVTKGDDVILVGRDEQRLKLPYGHRGEALKKWQDHCGEKYSCPFGRPYNGKLEIFPYDATATLYASSELLEQLGVRWYHPYENGTVVPERKTIVVSDQVLKKEPKFAVREFNFYNPMRVDADGVMWFKRLKYGSSYRSIFTHSTMHIIGGWDSAHEQKKLHPEYFAKVDGKMIGGKMGVPRLCGEEFRKSSSNYLNKCFEADPALKVVDLMPTDGFTKIDERDAKIWTRPDRGYNGKYSDYVWDYWLFAADALKKSHPDKYLVCWSYTPYGEPPSQVETFPDNVAIMFAQGTANSFLPQFNIDRLRGEFLKKLTSKKMYIYDYYLFYRTPERPRYPVVFTKHLQNDMKKLAGVCEGKHFEIAADSTEHGWRLACPGLMHLLVYLQGKLYWNPDLDLQVLLDEYYELYFGPAKTEMKEFYEFAEEVWMRPKSRSVGAGKLSFLQEEDVDRYFDILRRAREKAGEGTVYDKRIAEIETEMQPLKKIIAGMKRVGPDLQGYVTKDPVKIDGDLDKPFWRGEGWWKWYSMKDLVTGERLGKNGAKVSFRMTPDKSALVVGVECDESRMDSLAAKTTNHDDGNIFNDDVVEIYVATPERCYFKIVVNPNGAVWDESQDTTIVNRDTLPVLWEPGIQAAIKKFPNRWTAEVLIPTKDFGELGPSKQYPWGINVCRTRLAGGKPELSAISPTGKRCFAELSKLANLRVR